MEIVKSPQVILICSQGCEPLLTALTNSSFSLPVPETENENLCGRAGESGQEAVWPSGCFTCQLMAAPHRGGWNWGPARCSGEKGARFVELLPYLPTNCYFGMRTLGWMPTCVDPQVFGEAR